MDDIKQPWSDQIEMNGKWSLKNKVFFIKQRINYDILLQKMGGELQGGFPS